MINIDKNEKKISYVAGISLIGTIATLFNSSWKWSIAWLLAYILASDLLFAYKMAKRDM